MFLVVGAALFPPLKSRLEYLTPLPINSLVYLFKNTGGIRDRNHGMKLGFCF